jgi:hypothetical protein
LSDAVRTHALAFGAILDSQNGEAHSRLVRQADPAERLKREADTKELIASSWGIHNRDELLDTLAKLQSGKFGQRGGFWEIRQRLLEGRMENYLRVITALSSENYDGASAFIVATHLGPIHRNALPITAWDFGRYINVCRWGVECEWITEQEAWDRILPAARLLQASYSSWEEFAADYLLGRNFWNPQTAADNDTIRYTVALLRLPPSGLWSTIDWNESLGTGDTLHDALGEKLLDHHEDPDPLAVPLDQVPHTNPLIIMRNTSVDPK